LSFSSPGIYIATRKSKGLFSQGCREGRILKIAHFLENYDNTIGNVIFEIDALINVMLSKAEKYVLYGE